MHITYLKYNYNQELKDLEDYFKINIDDLQVYTFIKRAGIEKVTVLQRWLVDDEKSINDVQYIFVKDEYKEKIKWWQEPDKIHQITKSLNPDIIHIYGLNIPLHYRWIRRTIPDKTIVIGQHTVETIWPNIRIWLQQFGLRVVNGFIFEDIKVSKRWIKSAVILQRQPVFQIPKLSNNAEVCSKALVKIYNDLSSKEEYKQ